MKMVRVVCVGETYLKPIPVATGVQGGGYVGVSTRYAGGYKDFLGTKECLENLNDCVEIAQDKEYKYYLNEGESLYGKCSSSNGVTVYFVTYYNNEPSNQSQPAPINLTGTIQLNQQ